MSDEGWQEDLELSTAESLAECVATLTQQRDEAIQEVIQLCMQRGHCKFDGGYAVCDEHKHLFDLLKEEG